MKAIALLGLMAGIIACGDSTGPNARAASVTGFAGDSQEAPIGGAFEFPITFVTLDANGQPIENVHVSWTVTPVGGATFDPPTSISNANGQVTTTVTAGMVAQEITIHATVPGVSSPVDFSALILDPCLYVRGMVVNQTINGALSSLDCKVGSPGWFYDFYAFALPTGQQSIRITMNSADFDTYLDFFRADGRYEAFDDDVILGQVQNSQLDIILPGDVYIIGANSFDTATTGGYSLTLANRPAAMNGCRQVWVVNGVSVADSITAADCSDGALMPGRYDVARIWLTDSSTLTVAQRSPTINPNLALYQIVGGNVVNGNYPRVLVASNDDSTTGNPTAFISYSVPLNADGPYDLIIGTSSATETGAYTFDVSTAPAPSSRAAAPLMSARNWWRSAGASLKRSKL
jgi:hypothetical protein